MDSLVGKKAKGFKFSGAPTYIPNIMSKYDGVLGRIVYTDGNVVQIRFPDDKSWNYPHKEALNHLVEEELEEELTIEQILNNIKNLTKDL